MRQPLAVGEAMVTDWQAAGLIKASVPKPVFATLEQGLVVRTLGNLSAVDTATLRALLGEVIGQRG